MIMIIMIMIMVTKNDNENVDKAIWEDGEMTKLNNEKSVVYVVVNKVLQPEPKELDEIKGLITSDYQNHLEQEWVKELNSKYKVEVNKEVLKLVK